MVSKVTVRPWVDRSRSVWVATGATVVNCGPVLEKPKETGSLGVKKAR